MAELLSSDHLQQKMPMHRLLDSKPLSATYLSLFNTNPWGKKKLYLSFLLVLPWTPVHCIKSCEFPSFRSWNWTWKGDRDGCKMGSFPSHRWRHCLQSHSELLDVSAALMLHANSWTGILHFISVQTSYAGNGLNNCFVVTKASWVTNASGKL